MAFGRLACLCRLGLALAALVSVNLAPCPAWADGNEPQKRDGVWAQSYSDRPADPAVRFGQLGNGLRYAILRNTTPAGHVSLRLRIGAGSLDEREDQRGLAHFLEHMAFRGSAHVPSGDMVRMLQRLGLAYGADTNAHTTFDETIYQFDLPNSDHNTLDTGMMLLREIAGELNLAQSEMDPERGVVLSEERLRDGPAYRMTVAELGLLLEGQLVPQRMPIGKTEIIRDAPVSLIRDFYNAWYRPGNATVVVVGDVDVAAMEEAIRTRFGDWTSTPNGQPARNLGAVMARGATVRLLVAPGAPETLLLSWVGPYDATADVAARERRDLAQILVLSVLNERLARLAERADAPFLSASAGSSNYLQSALITELRLQPKPGAWEAALQAAVTVQRQLVEFGATPDEFERATTKIRTQMRNAANAQATRTSNGIADLIVQSVNDNEVFTSPEQDRDEVESILRTTGRDAIQAAARHLFAGSGPLLALEGPAEIPGGEAKVAATLAHVLAQEVTAASAEAAKVWPYLPAATPGPVAQRSRIDDLDVTEVRFANGVRLAVKRTEFARDEVRVRVRVGYGRLDISRQLAPAAWQSSGSVPLLRLGGTQELTFQEIQALTAENRITLSESLDDDAFLLDGVTRPADLDRQLELLQATTTQPGLRAAAFERVRGTLLNQLPQMDATAAGVFGRAFGPAVHGGDLRWQSIPDSATLTQARPEDLAALVGKDFAEGPIEVTIVGDIDPDRAIDAVARSYGALPPRPAREAPDPAAATVRFPSPGPAPLVVTHGGRADQAMAMVAWPTADFFADPQAQRVLGVMAAILQSRLTDRFRAAEGLTYALQVGTDSSDVFRGVGYVYALVETPVGKVDAFYAELGRLANELRAANPTDDELERAKRPRVEDRIKRLRENRYWLDRLAAAQGDPRVFDAIRNLVSGTEQVSAEDVHQAAERFLKPDTEFRMLVLPAAR
jgi:zinc protease